METTLITQYIQETVSWIKNQITEKPQLAIVLGSGLGEFAREIEIEKKFSYSEVPHFQKTTVEGHSGNLIFGKIAGKRIAALQGRFHFYEGHPMSSVVFPIRTLALLGVDTFILTNSAGGLKDGMEAGDLMILDDHINMMGANPLMGPNIKEFGPRFPDMTEAYDKKLIALMETILKKHQVRHHKGVYCALSGPTYETPAEVRLLKMLGADAVGMSTVPETIAAHHLGARVTALSCISNLGAGIAKHKLSHAEVTETAQRVEKQFSAVLKDFIAQI